MTSLADLFNRQRQDGDTSSTQNTGLGQYLVPEGSTYAQRQLAALYRREWEDYKSRYIPKIRELIRFATDENQPQISALQSGEAVDRAYNNISGDTERTLASYGVSESADERENRLRLTHNSRLAAKADAQNKTRIHVKDLQNQVLSGNLSVGLKESRIGT